MFSQPTSRIEVSAPNSIQADDEQVNSGAFWFGKNSDTLELRERRHDDIFSNDADRAAMVLEYPDGSKLSSGIRSRRKTREFHPSN